MHNALHRRWVLQWYRAVREGVYITVKANYTKMENSTHVVYTTEYYIAEAAVATWTRG
ncbi:MAG: hypothetical protein LM558_05155 [Thermosphaera sp.]|nr:hypothetical protein [Thermosphaera sp.]